MTKVRTAFIGLGVMGFPMAGHLAAAGYPVTVYNRTRGKAEQWVEQHGGSLAPTPAKAAAEAEIVFSCVGNDADLDEVMRGESGILAGARLGTIVIDHTTASAKIARALAEAAAETSLSFLDAPVSGGQAGAEKGALTVMVGGEPEPFARAEPAMRTYGRAVTLMGPAGSGQLTKMANQVCIAGLLQGLSEALALAERAGLDGRRVVEVISKGAAQSWQMDNRALSMLDDEFDFGFAVNWMRKDLAIVLDEARSNGASVPVTAIVDQFYARIQDQGGGRWDTSSLIRLLR